MTIQFDVAAREVLEQVVREPRFRSLTAIPLVAPVEIALILFAFGVFTAASLLYLNGDIP